MSQQNWSDLAMSSAQITRENAKVMIKGKTFYVNYPTRTGNKYCKSKIGTGCGLCKWNSGTSKWVNWAEGMKYLGIDANTNARRAIHLCWFAYGRATSLQDAANQLAIIVDQARNAYYIDKGYY